MRLDITPVTRDDAASLDRLLAVAEVSYKRHVPAFPPPTRRGYERGFDFPFPGNVTEHYVAIAAGETVGSASLTYYTEDNLDKVQVEVFVLPEHRRRGHGSAILAFLENRARELGRTTVNGGTLWNLPGIPADEDGGPEFARAKGYRDTLPEVNRVLTLADVDESTLDDMVKHAWEKADGYRLVRWNDPTPEEFIHDVAYLDGRLLADAPMGDTGWEPMNVDAERVRKTEEVIIARGRTSFHTGAVDEKSGRIVAWTTITAEDDCPWHAWQQITIVDPDHRGHRLGAVVKVENLRWFRERNPAVTVIDTFNAAENSYMIAINEQMGFRPQYAFQNWRRDF